MDCCDKLNDAPPQQTEDSFTPSKGPGRISRESRAIIMYPTELHGRKAPTITYKSMPLNFTVYYIVEAFKEITENHGLNILKPERDIPFQSEEFVPQNRNVERKGCQCLKK